MKKRILILSGPTHEYIDPVRFIGNASSGKMGRALAEEAAKRGYEIDFVTGPVAKENLPQAGALHRVTSAAEMLCEAQKLFSAADLIIFAAAVADYAPAEKLEQKRGKSKEDWVLNLCPTSDIAQTLCVEKRVDQIAIGFALQTGAGEANARRKLAAKNLDGIVLNSPTSLGAKNGSFSYLAAGVDAFDDWGCIDKTTCAKQLFEAINRRSV